MNPAIEALHALQVEDLRMVTLEKRLAAIPHRLDEMKRDHAALESMLASERQKLVESHAFRRDQEEQLLGEEDHIRQSKARMGAVKNPRELTATQREIETTRRMRDARQEEIVRIGTAVAAAEARIASTEESLAALGRSFASERERLEIERAEIVATLQTTQRARGELVRSVDPELLQVYERVRRRAGGVAFVPVRQQRCLACRMQVPHGMYVALRKGDEVPHCESCGRLLFWAGHFPEQYPVAELPPPPSKPKRRSSKAAGPSDAVGEPDAAGSE